MGLSYKVPKLFHQRIILVWKVAGVDSKPLRQRALGGKEPMRHWLAMSNTGVENNAVVEVEIRGVIKKVARIHIMDSNMSRCWEPRRHQLSHAPYSSQMHSRSS